MSHFSNIWNNNNTILTLLTEKWKYYIIKLGVVPTFPLNSLSFLSCFCFMIFNGNFSSILVGGAVASWLVRSTQDRAVRVRDLAGDIALCSWARHLTLTLPLSTQVYKWVPANLILGVTLRLD